MVSALDSGSGGPGWSNGWGSALYSWARHLTLIVPLSTQLYKWIPAMTYVNNSTSLMDKFPFSPGYYLARTFPSSKLNFNHLLCWSVTINNT